MVPVEDVIVYLVHDEVSVSVVNEPEEHPLLQRAKKICFPISADVAALIHTLPVTGLVKLKVVPLKRTALLGPVLEMPDIKSARLADVVPSGEVSTDAVIVTPVLTQLLAVKTELFIRAFVRLSSIKIPLAAWVTGS